MEEHEHFLKVAKQILDTVKKPKQDNSEEISKYRKELETAFFNIEKSLDERILLGLIQPEEKAQLIELVVELKEF